MARKISPRCKECRKEGEKLFLKGERCFTDKCALSRRESISQGKRRRRRRLSPYSLQLRAKQRLKAVYGVLESQFFGYFQLATKKGNPTLNLLPLLERRLDNVVYKLGFVSSRPQARQLIRHGHIAVNNRKMDIPSYLVKEKDVISLRKRAKEFKVVKENLESRDPSQIVPWLSLDKEKGMGEVVRLPQNEDIGEVVADPQLVVEIYSK